MEEKDSVDELAGLRNQQEFIRESESLDYRVLEYCRGLSQNPESPNFHETRLLLDAFDIKVFAYRSRNVVRELLLPRRGASPSYVTIGRTSGCAHVDSEFSRFRVLYERRQPQIVHVITYLQ